ncbi:sensor histidine kinase [Microbacterium sp. DT81.1]|uniref:sensor histidine kinase n=1 Tax=Microbacterium sp. DT81.1 TaxID=3393413 RepID=UPI003CF3D0D9
MLRTEQDAAWASRRGWAPPPAVYDRAALIVSLLAILVGVGMLAVQSGPAAGYVSLGVTAVGIIISRRFPWPGLAVVLLACAWGLVVWNPVLPWTIAVLTVLSLTVRGARALLAGLVTGVSMYLADVYVSGLDWLDASALAAFSLSLAAAGLGSANFNRDRYWAALELRARDAVASRESEANRRVAEERIRIARDLHDVVGHQVAIVSVQLGVAEVNLPAGSEASRTALEAARSGTQAVLRETQAILTVLRRGDSSADEGQPTPGVADLPGLIDSYQAIGLDVDAAVGVMPSTLSATVDTAVFRIVQEALTNAHRYGAGTVHLTVSAVGGIITIECRNARDAVAVRSAGRGFGLVGMHERAQSAGGSVVITDDGDTFLLRVTVRADGRLTP